jgi:hypothetical protein
MFWDTILVSFNDEMEKIALSLSGISTDTLLNYPKQQIMATPGVEKAQKVIDKLPSIKTAAYGPPDQLPNFGRIFSTKKKKEPPPGKIEKAKSVGGHALAGAGSAKFMGDFAESALAAAKPSAKVLNHQYYWGKFPPKVRAGIMGTGASLGIAERFRKEHKRKKAN